MSRRCYTLDVNPTSSSRVKVRLYETRPVRGGGNILLLQGQLSVTQFQALEELLLAGAAVEGAELSLLGRHYAQPGALQAAPEPARESPGERRAAARAIRLVEDPPRAPGIRGPVIGPDGVVEEGEDDYGALARRHVQRLLQRRRASVG